MLAKGIGRQKKKGDDLPKRLWGAYPKMKRFRKER
jgi:hypothetical protein